MSSMTYSNEQTSHVSCDRDANVQDSPASCDFKNEVLPSTSSQESARNIQTLSTSDDGLSNVLTLSSSNDCVSNVQTCDSNTGVLTMPTGCVANVQELSSSYDSFANVQTSPTSYDNKTNVLTCLSSYDSFANVQTSLTSDDSMESIQTSFAGYDSVSDIQTSPNSVVKTQPLSSRYDSNTNSYDSKTKPQTFHTDYDSLSSSYDRVSNSQTFPSSCDSFENIQTLSISYDSKTNIQTGYQALPSSCDRVASIQTSPSRHDSKTNIQTLSSSCDGVSKIQTLPTSDNSVGNPLASLSDFQTTCDIKPDIQILQQRLIAINGRVDSPQDRETNGEINGQTGPLTYIETSSHTVKSEDGTNVQSEAHRHGVITEDRVRMDLPVASSQSVDVKPEPIAEIKTDTMQGGEAVHHDYSDNSFSSAAPSLNAGHQPVTIIETSSHTVKSEDGTNVQSEAHKHGVITEDRVRMDLPVASSQSVDVKPEPIAEIKTDTMQGGEAVHHDYSDNSFRSAAPSLNAGHQPVTIIVKQEPGTMDDLQANEDSVAHRYPVLQNMLQGHPIHTQGTGSQNYSVNLKTEEPDQSLQTISLCPPIRECRVVLKKEMLDVCRPYLREMIGFEAESSPLKSLQDQAVEPLTVQKVPVSNNQRKGGSSPHNRSCKSRIPYNLRCRKPETGKTDEGKQEEEMPEPASYQIRRKYYFGKSKKIRTFVSSIPRMRKRAASFNISKIEKMAIEPHTYYFGKSKKIRTFVSSIPRMRKRAASFNISKTEKMAIEPHTPKTKKKAAGLRQTYAAMPAKKKVKKRRRKVPKAVLIARFLGGKRKKKENLSTVDEVDDNLNVVFCTTEAGGSGEIKIEEDQKDQLPGLDAQTINELFTQDLHHSGGSEDMKPNNPAAID